MPRAVIAALACVTAGSLLLRTGILHSGCSTWPRRRSAVRTELFEKLSR